MLCAGLIGWRSLKAAGEAETIGLYGFGAAAHIIAQVCRWQGRRVFAFTRDGRSGLPALRAVAGAEWAGVFGRDAAGAARRRDHLRARRRARSGGARGVAKGGRVVCAGIHMSDIPSFPYRLLWGERSVASVANLTRADGVELLELAARVGVRTTTRAYPLEAANEALADLREGRLEGAAVLLP